LQLNANISTTTPTFVKAAITATTLTFQTSASSPTTSARPATEEVSVSLVSTSTDLLSKELASTTLRAKMKLDTPNSSIIPFAMLLKELNACHVSTNLI